MTFTADEVAYLGSQPLARLATAGDEEQPDVSPVGFEFDGSVFWVGGRDLRATRKLRNVEAGRTKVALVVDDLVTTDPWTPRFLRVYGVAEVVERVGRFGPGTYLKITPMVSWSWNLAGRPVGEVYSQPPRRTRHGDPADSGDAD